MPNKEEESKSHRMVVEEIEIPEKNSKEVIEKPVETPKADILEEGVNTSQMDAPENLETKTSTENVAPVAPQPVEKKSRSPVFWIIIPGIFLLGAILGGIVFYQKGVNSKSETTPSPTSTATAAPTTTATPSATVDVSKFDIAVFNGSGTPGEAGKVKTLLEAAGFSVTSTANAATYDFTKTIIKAKSTVDASVVQKLKDTLSKSYVVGDNQTLASNSTTDIQVVVGSSKAE